MRGVTKGDQGETGPQGISIHTPHAGSDRNGQDGKQGPQGISIHTPHAGSDRVTESVPARLHISIHTPHAGSDEIPLPLSS